MKWLGAHLSISKGLDTLQKQMDILESDTCALFLKSSRSFAAKPLTKEAITAFKKAVKHPERLLPHGSYIINLANDTVGDKHYDCLVDDLRRCHSLGILYYNLHPGADVNQTGERALSIIAKRLNQALKDVPGVIILLENMAGQGTVCCRTFREIACIIDQIEDKSRIGVTLDTCHLFGAGYDIRTGENFENIMQEFDKVVGMKYLKAMHLNDSKCPLNSRKDRHEQLGKGLIGLEAFRYIMNSRYFEEMPLILETPDPNEYKNEIQLLRSFVKD
ncbi:deoxyribonuclease IV [Pancytospora epiphaga]|nr:deoxyribonuclease IV [Pancytospora epiphaga]